LFFGRDFPEGVSPPKCVSFEKQAICELYRILRSSRKRKTDAEFWSRELMIACSEHSQRTALDTFIWCVEETKRYPGVEIKDFQESFKDGLAFCAIIHSHRPDLLDYQELTVYSARTRLEVAFFVAEEELGIPRLLNIDDVVSTQRHDERLVVTYLNALRSTFCPRVDPIVDYLDHTEEKERDMSIIDLAIFDKQAFGPTCTSCTM